MHGLNDGGAALVLMSEDRAKQEGRKPLATILAHTAIAVESKDFRERRQLTHCLKNRQDN